MDYITNREPWIYWNVYIMLPYNSEQIVVLGGIIKVITRASLFSVRQIMVSRFIVIVGVVYYIYFRTFDLMVPLLNSIISDAFTRQACWKVIRCTCIQVSISGRSSWCKVFQ